MAKIDLSIIIVSYNVSSLLRNCLLSIYEHQDTLSFEIFVVDNASNDDSVQMVADEFPEVNLIVNTKNKGFAAANNQAISQASGQYTLLLNPDTVVVSGALGRLVKVLDENPQVGIVGPKLLNKDGTLQPSCYSFPNLINYSIYSFASYRLIPKQSRVLPLFLESWDHSYSADIRGFLLGAAIAVRSSLWERVGILDESFFVYGEEKDLCYRAIQAGYKIHFDPVAQIVHHGGQSSKTVERESLIYLYDSLSRFIYLYYSGWYAALLVGILYLGLLAKYVLFSFRDTLARLRGRAVQNDLKKYLFVFWNKKSRTSLLVR